MITRYVLFAEAHEVLASSLVAHFIRFDYTYSIVFTSTPSQLNNRFEFQPNLDKTTNLFVTTDFVYLNKILLYFIGTHTGKALTYAGEVMLSMSRGRRRGAQAVVIVVTDGKSLDDVTKPSQLLRSKGIQVEICLYVCSADIKLKI